MRLSTLARPSLIARIAVAITITVGLLLVIATVVAGRTTISFVDDSDWQLATDEDIRAIASIGRASYLPGERLHYRLQVAWRPERVTPDFDALERNVSFHPFDHVQRRVATRSHGGGVRGYVADFTLQVIDVDASASYDLATVTVFYTRRDDDANEVQAFRTNAPRVHIGEYYPADVTAIGLLPTKPRIEEARTLRRSAFIAGGVLLLATLVAVLWWRGRRRPYTTLAPAEQLWRDFAAAKRRSDHTRWQLVEYEKFAARAFELCAGIAPVDFWMSGQLGEWQERVDVVRELVSGAYRADGPAGDDVAALGTLIDDLLRPVVEEERLQHELRNRVVERLRGQPRVLAASAGLLITSILAFVLAASPSLWLPADVRHFNAAVELFEQGEDLQAVVDTFVAVADGTSDNRVRSAALYNVGTLLVDPALSRLSRDQYRAFMQAIFTPDITMDGLLHDMELDAEFELITLLTELTRQYVQAEQMLRAAIRAGPVDSDMGRNLEILGKTRRAIARSLAQLAQLGVDAPGTQQMLSQTVIDLRLLMETELPDDYARLDEGKDDRDYFIMEKF